MSVAAVDRHDAESGDGLTSTQSGVVLTQGHSVSVGNTSQTVYCDAPSASTRNSAVPSASASWQLMTVPPVADGLPGYFVVAGLAGSPATLGDGLQLDDSSHHDDGEEDASGLLTAAQRLAALDADFASLGWIRGRDRDAG